MRKKIKKNLIIIGMLLCFSIFFSITTHAEEVDYIKGRPLTQDEIEEQKTYEKSTNDNKDVDFQAAPTVSTYNRNSTFFESRYDSREKNYITDVKNQNPYGACWAFSGISAAETSAIKELGYSRNIDYSEFHLAYFLYHTVPDPLGLSKGDSVNISSSDFLDYGGNMYFAAQSLANGVGVAQESLLPYPNDGNITIPSDELAYNRDLSLKNAYYLYEYNGTSEGVSQTMLERKQAIKDYGCVTAAYFHNFSYYNYDTAAYCIKNTYTTNHAITIVGWDDNYSKNNFKSESGVDSDGAWIVKNSWGSQWGDDGYYYISYEDSSLRGGMAFEYTDSKAYDNNYHYDGTTGLVTDSVDNGGKIANIFRAEANSTGSEVLNAVNFSVFSTNTKYEIQIYKNIQDISNPMSGTAALDQPVVGYTSYEGIYTVNLNQNVLLSEGEYFSIVITLSNNVSGYVYYGVDSDANYSWIWMNASTSKNQSFCQNTVDSQWEDLSDYQYCARIKAYTKNIDKWSIDSISTDVSSPQLINQPIGIHVNINGMHDNLQFKYVWMKDNWKKWGVIADASSSETATWDPKESGDYIIYVDILEDNRIIETHTIKYMIQQWQCSGIVSDLQSPQITNNHINLTPDIQGDCNQFQYKYVWMKNNWKSWGVIQNFSQTKSAQWNPKDYGQYTLYLDIKDRVGKIVTYCCTYMILEKDWSFDNITCQLSSPQEIGTSVSIMPSISGNTDDLSYKYVWMKDNWKQWGILKDFSSDNHFTWTPNSSGNYKLYIDVKDSLGNCCSQNISYSIKEGQWVFNGFQPSLQSPQGKNTKINFDCNISGNTHGLTYKYVWMKNNWSSWGVLNPFSTSKEVEWEPTSPGLYSIYLDIKNSAGTIKTYTCPYYIADWNYEKITLSSQNVSVGESVLIQPVIENKYLSNLQYKYVWMKDNWHEWGVIHDFSDQDTGVWNPKETGKYNIYVDVKENGDVRTKQVVCNVK